MTDLEQAREFFRNDRFATVNGAVIDEIGDGYAVCSMALTDDHKNALGNVMGGAIFTLADFCFAVAANWGKKAAVSTVSQITFLRAARGDLLYARAEAVREGRTTVYYEGSVTDADGRIIARFTSSGQVVG